jgi:hypothetical protein
MACCVLTAGFIALLMFAKAKVAGGSCKTLEGALQWRLDRADYDE